MSNKHFQILDTLKGEYISKDKEIGGGSSDPNIESS